MAIRLPFSVKDIAAREARLGVMIVAFRIFFAGLSVLVSAVAAAVTNVFTNGWAWPWGVALAALVAVGVGLQAGLVLVEGRGRRSVRAEGAGAVAVGGSVHGPVTTRVRGRWGPVDAGHQTAGDVRASASDAGGVAVAGDVGGAVETSVEGDAGGRVW